MTATERTTCRACGDSDLVTVLDLGWQPLANGFLRDDQLDLPEPEYRLHLVRCLTCGLVQLTHVVDPALLYGQHYAYRSGYSEGWREHCRQLAEEIGPHKRVLDVGCLDGVLLGECGRLGCSITGIDPSGTDELTIKRAFDRDYRADEPFDVVVAQNVFGHVDDAKGFLEGVAANLAPDGYAVIECPWVVPMICEGRWDTIYHEHLSYWGIYPLQWVAEAAGLFVVNAHHFPWIHGGTVRYKLGREPGWPFQDLYVSRDEAAVTTDDHMRFAIRSYGDMKRWDKYFQNINGKSVAAYGASAKLSTFLNALPNRPPLVGVFDDNPTKWNLYTPGCHYPVLVPTEMTMQETDVLLIGAPNWKDEIEAKARALGFAGEVKSLW